MILLVLDAHTHKRLLPSPLPTCFAHYTSHVSLSQRCASFISAALGLIMLSTPTTCIYQSTKTVLQLHPFPSAPTNHHHRWPLIIFMAYSDTISPCLWTDNLIDMVCRLRGNVNTGQSYWRLPFSSDFYFQSFVMREVPIISFSF